VARHVGGLAAQPIAASAASIEGLTDAQIAAFSAEWSKSVGHYDFERNDFYGMIRAIEREVIATQSAKQGAAVPSDQHPVQPLANDEHGRLRFKRNSIVDFLANGRLNELASMDFPQADWEQLAQLIGYSLDGFGTLSYVTDETYERAAAQVAAPTSHAQVLAAGLAKSIDARAAFAIRAMPVERDENGWWSHPGIPNFDEDHKSFAAWVKAVGLEVKYKCLESYPEHPLYDAWFEDGECNASSWEPEAPSGDGWFTFSIHDTEDGPVWVWARPVALKTASASNEQGGAK
jgi:hypothetical protein